MTLAVRTLGKQGFPFRNKWLIGWSSAVFLKQYGSASIALRNVWFLFDVGQRKSSQVFSINQKTHEYHYDCIDRVYDPPHKN
jgi:hypothetical protein